jgi:hypothetical protein
LKISRLNTANRLNISLHHFQPAYHSIIMPSGDIATTFKRLKNTIADYDNQLIKASNIFQTFDQKKGGMFFLET